MHEQNGILVSDCARKFLRLHFTFVISIMKEKSQRE